jgi:hypothetical protein
MIDSLGSILIVVVVGQSLNRCTKSHSHRHHRESEDVCSLPILCGTNDVDPSPDFWQWRVVIIATQSFHTVEIRHEPKNSESLGSWTVAWAP